MPALKPWHKVVDPRDDLRQGRPLDASEFAVHLDKVRDGTAPEDYKDAKRFFDRTYLTKNLLGFGAEVVRRLSGIKTETSAVFNMATQFGGGKTHALTLLFHLAINGRKAESWSGVRDLMQKAHVDSNPLAAVATFVGTEFDSLAGRGGKDGTPLRKTPWGEIAWQLGKEQSFAVVAEHEKTQTAPAGDVIRLMLPRGKPCLILMDEILNYISRNRRSGLSAQFYHFLHNLSETVRGEDNVVLAVSIPKSETIEMTVEDQADFNLYKHMLDRLGKAVIMAAEEETSEIIRRRLFNWNGLPDEGRAVADAWGEWMRANRDLLPRWFPVDSAKERIEATYPFHPIALSVFERKWQSLPRFQQTRGILRLLALWVSTSFQAGYKEANNDPLIGLGTAPLEDPIFRTAVFEQLGEPRLEPAVTTDICGKVDSHAMRLDADAVDTIRKARVHRKAATVIFFESNGGQGGDHAATVPEVRLSVAEPDLEIGNIDTALEALGDSCYYLRVEKNKYKFGLAPNLNKMLADRRAGIDAKNVEETLRGEVLKAFGTLPGVDIVPFPEKSSQILDRPVLSIAILAPETNLSRDTTKPMVEAMISEHGNSGRTFKSAVIFACAEDDSAMRAEAQKLLAWAAIKDEEEGRLDDAQRQQLIESLGRARRDLRESVCRAFRYVLLLDKKNQLRQTDLGMFNSSQYPSIAKLVAQRLQQEGDLETSPVSPNYLVRNWPGSSKWSTLSVRDCFFASPQFPRLLDGDLIRQTIAKGVQEGTLAYSGRGSASADGLLFKMPMQAGDVEISAETFILRAEDARKLAEPATLRRLEIRPDSPVVKPGTAVSFRVEGFDQHDRTIPVGTVDWHADGGTIDSTGRFTAARSEGPATIEAVSSGVRATRTLTVGSAPGHVTTQHGAASIKGISWSGEISHQKWMNFYTKVLARFATAGGIKLRVSLEICPEGGLSERQVEETRAAIKEIGADGDMIKMQ